jgi:hypothetical protein
MLDRNCTLLIELSDSGKYDEDYIDYVIEVLRKCRQHGLLAFMDPHQDVVITDLTMADDCGLDSLGDQELQCGR